MGLAPERREMCALAHGMLHAMLVAGLDACRAGWAGVALEDGRFTEADLFTTAAEALERWREAATIVIDIPIGLPGDGNVGFPRAADQQARKFLQSWRAASSVFLTASAAVLQARTFEQAQEVMHTVHGIGISRQAFALAPKILEVRDLASADRRVIEGHPEVSFRKMASSSGMLPGASSRKKTWDGLNERLTALRDVGVDLPDRLGSAGEAGTDDVVDAALMAWTAQAVARNASGTYPEPPVERGHAGRPVAIHFPS